MTEQEISIQKIKDLTEIFVTNYEYVLTYGGVDVTVSEILLAVNSFHAAVILDIEAGRFSEGPMTEEQHKDLRVGSVTAFMQALEQEGKDAD